MYFDPDYLSEKDGATTPPRWVYFTYAAFFLLGMRITHTHEVDLGGQQACLYTKVSTL